MATRPSRATGCYALIVTLRRRADLAYGRAGVARLPRGAYVYIGSAMGGLEARIARHRRAAEAKRPHWHIDKLLAIAPLRAVFARESGRREECRMAGRLAARFSSVAGFGASDCRCPTHLFRAPSRAVARAALRAEGFTPWPRRPGPTRTDLKPKGATSAK